ncbi:hypothetical protein D3C80_2189030 [compost metagenome]
MEIQSLKRSLVFEPPASVTVTAPTVAVPSTVGVVGVVVVVAIVVAVVVSL